MRLARTAAPLPRKIWSAGIEPAVSGSRSRRGGLLPYSQKTFVRVPPAGLEPAASGLRARRHRRFDHGGMRLRRQDSNLPLAINSRASYRLDYAGTRRRQQDSNLRGRKPPYALARRCLPSSAMPPQGGRRGSRTPKTRRPTRFRDGVPRQWQSFQSGPGRRRTCTVPGKNRALCRLSYGAEGVAGRNRTCLSRVTVARLTDSTTPERKMEACLQEAEGEGVEPPRPGGPPVFETGYRAGGSPSRVAPAGVEPAPSRVRTGSSAG